MPSKETDGCPSDVKDRIAPLIPWIALVLGAILLFLFASSIEDQHHPLIICAALVFLCYPWLSDRRVSRTVQTILGLTILWFLWTMKDILTPLIVAAGLAYICSPVFLWLRGEKGRWRPLKLNSTIASLVVTVLLFGFLGMIGAQTGTLLVGQANEFATILDESIVRVQSIFPPSWNDSMILKGLSEGIVLTVSEIGDRLPDLARGVAGGMGYALTGMLGLLMTLVFFFYVLRDSGELLRGVWQRYLPDSMHAFVNSRSDRITRTLKNFIEGYFLTSSVVFVLTLTLLLIADVRMAFLLALVAALLNIIPVIGFWVSTVLTMVTALASGMSLGDVLIIGGGLAAINVFEGNFLQPRIIGRKVGLHPVVAIISVAIFGRILGFLGVLLGIPLAAVLTSEWEEYLVRRRSNRTERN